MFDVELQRARNNFIRVPSIPIIILLVMCSLQVSDCSLNGLQLYVQDVPGFDGLVPIELEMDANTRDLRRVVGSLMPHSMLFTLSCGSTIIGESSAETPLADIAICAESTIRVAPLQPHVTQMLKFLDLFQGGNGRFQALKQRVRGGMAYSVSIADIMTDGGYVVDETGKITHICISNMGLRGSLDLRSVPDTCRWLITHNNDLTYISSRGVTSSKQEFLDLAAIFSLDHDEIERVVEEFPLNSLRRGSYVMSSRPYSSRIIARRDMSKPY